jgi:hypothetical protein
MGSNILSEFPTNDFNDTNRSTFDELMNLLSNCTIPDQMSLDNKIELCLLQLQVLEIKNFGLEQSIKLRKVFKNDLIERENRWNELNDQLNKLVNIMVELKEDVNEFSLRIHIAFEKKLNYLNFLLQSAKRSMNNESLKQFLLECNKDNKPYSIVMREHHFELNAIKNVNYDLVGLTKLAKKVENQLRGIYYFFLINIYFQMLIVII